MTGSENARCEIALAQYIKDGGGWDRHLTDDDKERLREFWKWSWELAITAPRPAPEGTVLVRIPVVVDKDGAWAATALCIDSDEDAIESANEWLDGASATAQHERRLSWVTAHVPLPAAPVEVQGSVTDA